MNYDEKTQEIEIPILKNTTSKVVRVDFAAMQAARPSQPRSTPAEVMPIYRRKLTWIEKIQDRDSENPYLTRLGIVLVILLLSLLIL